MKKRTTIMFGLIILFVITISVFSFSKNNKKEEQKDHKGFYEEYVYTDEDNRIVQEMKNIRTVSSVDLDMIVFDSLDGLEDFSDIIIIGSPTKHLIESETVVEYSTSNPEMISDFYSKIPLKIETILKGKDLLKDDGQITFNMSWVGFIKDKNGNSSLFKAGDISPFYAKKGYEYILFLKYSPVVGEYFIYPGDYGIINIDGRDEEAMRHFGTGDSIRKSALKKYQKEIEELGISMEEKDKAENPKKEETPPVISSLEATVSSSETN